jgi:hypothetical protein
MYTHITRGLAAISRFGRTVLRALGRFGSRLAEFQRQQDRLAASRLSLDPYLTDPAAPPETYEEFLVRTCGPLRREPSARSRLAGHGVR